MLITTKSVILPILLGAAFFSAGGYLIGRNISPAEVNTKDHLEQRAKTTIEEKTRSEERKDIQQDVAKDVERIKRTTRFPDGRVVTEEKNQDKTKVETKTVETKVQTVVVEKRVEVVKVEVHERTVTRHPGWTIGVNAGVSVPALLGRSVPSYLPSVPSAVVLGLSIEKHLFWNVYGGVWANSQGVVGLSAQGGF